MKPQNQAKTRLRDATPSSARHAELVRAIQLDTLTAVRITRSELAIAELEHRAGAPGPGNGGGLHPAGRVEIAGIHIVGDTDLIGEEGEDGVHLIRDPGSGLNAALAETAHRLMRQWPADAVLAMVADLPALRPTELRSVLLNAATVARGVVIDAAGSGTTMLTARPGESLRPEFGTDSAARHRASGAVPLAADLGARTDVDTAADLQSCLRLGVGEHTARVVAHLL